MKDIESVSNKHYISNKFIHHQNLLSLSYGKIKRKDIHSKKGLLPTSFDTYQIVQDGVIVMRLTDLQNDKKSLRVAIATEEGIVSPAYICISVKENTSPSFIYQQLYYYDAILKLFYQMGDGMRQSLSFNDIKTLQIYVPILQEQCNIVSFYDYLESYITLQETKLLKTRSLKQYLLQKMFV